MDLMHGVSSVREIVTFVLGTTSVLCWGVAEIPQIITNFKEKSAEGLAVTFLMTWIIGDIFNLVGCYLEPATLPTQFYMALLYTAVTILLAGQTIYYGRLNKCKASEIEKLEQEDALRKEKLILNKGNETGSSPNETGQNIASSPILVARSVRCYGSMGRDLYYMSARFLSSSPVPTSGFSLGHTRDSYNPSPSKMPPTLIEDEDSSQVPLLGRLPSHLRTPPLDIKNTFCVVSSALFFVGICGLQFSLNDTNTQGMVIPIGRKILQHHALESSVSEGSGSSEVGNLLGWAMAAIYMGGRLPQIWLNIRRGNVEGLNPFMFVLAVVGNSTYVGSILSNSLEWSTIKPNLPWLVDAVGCVLLDSFILIQFFYFKYRRSRNSEKSYDV
ncbi:hypothetical protein KSP40_PGU015562 [Platanthera guangdongensis]